MWYSDVCKMQIEEKMRQNNINMIKAFETQFPDMVFSELQSQFGHVWTDDHKSHYLDNTTGTIYSWDHVAKIWKTDSITNKNKDLIKRLFG